MIHGKLVQSLIILISSLGELNFTICMYQKKITHKLFSVNCLLLGLPYESPSRKMQAIVRRQKVGSWSQAFHA